MKMNAYQKAAALICGVLLPLLLLVVAAMEDASVWRVAAVGIALSSGLIYRLRKMPEAQAQ